jgi:hypothetical protein
LPVIAGGVQLQDLIFRTRPDVVAEPVEPDLAYTFIGLAGLALRQEVALVLRLTP